MLTVSNNFDQIDWRLYSISFSSYTEGTDFEGAAGRLVFTPTGVKSQEIDILIKDDQELEQNEPIIIQFSSPSIPSDESLNLPNSTVVIIDNEIGGPLYDLHLVSGLIDLSCRD